MRVTPRHKIRFGIALAAAMGFMWSAVTSAGAVSSFTAAQDGFAVSSQSKTKASKKKGKGGQTAKPAAGSEGPLPRTPFTAADQQAAAIANMPDARFWAESETEYLRALPPKPGPWLILSTGGEDGAFGAGLLSGWSKAGTRPEFSLVTGVSTGALIAPFAFLGSRYDEQLRDAYTTISAIDIFEVGGKGESFLDTGRCTS
jgi:hypothetical protein